MYIEKIYIKNFRNIKDETIIPINGINILIGNNAQGKTNFLEAIYVLANLKSFRGKKLSEIINNDSEKAFINIKIRKKNVSNNIVLEVGNEIKKILLNNKTPTKITESLGFLNTVLFYPDDIIVVKGSPSLRRNLIDRAIFQTDNTYLSLFQDYLHCLKQRNAALKEKDEISDLWDNQFVELATRVTFHRVSYIERINRILGDIFEKTYKSGETVKVKYPFYAEDISIFKKTLFSRLVSGKAKERLYGITQIGPHRDDPQFFMNDQPLSLYGSQGQQRSFMLAFKTAQIIDFKEKCGIRPILLLDDMTSELDENRKNSFLDSLLIQAGQVFITSTDLNLMKHRRFSNSNFLKMENGKIGEYN